ncbi:MAG: EamA family transporter [Chloroflexota bacterium]
MPADLLAAAAGLLAAAFWGAADFGGGFATKRLPAMVVLLGSHLVGFAGAVVGMVLLGEGPPAPADSAWAVAAAFFGALGLAALYRALADGRMGIVAPITGVLTAAIPVAVGVATAGLPGPIRLAGFGIALLAIILVSLVDDGTTGRGGLLLAIGAGLGFGLYSACVGQVETGVFGPLMVSRATSSILVAAIVAARRTPLQAVASAEPRLLKLIVLVGVLDLVGNAMFLAAAQASGLALAAMLGSLYPVSTVILATVVLREPIGRIHAIGIAAAALAGILIVGGA